MARRVVSATSGNTETVIQEFDISITTVGDDKYLVRTESFAPGVPLAEEQLVWPVDAWLKQTKALMHDPLLGLAKGQATRSSILRSGGFNESAPGQKVPGSIVDLGKDLYGHLFRGLLRDSWLAAQSVAQNRGYLLRLRLGIKDTRLQQLPWEVLHGGDRPLATVTDIAFSRYSSDRRRTADYNSVVLPDYSQPLNVLMVIAAPSDQDRLDLKREVHDLQTELHPVSSSLGNLRSGQPDAQESAVLDVRLKILEQPGRVELTQALEQGNFQAFHYSGHSNLGNAGGDLYLVSRQTGLTERLSGEDLAGLLVNNGVKLAVFNSCRGAYTADENTGWQEQNLAQALVNRGIPAVIAMAEQIPDDVAIDFTKLLYRNLRKGSPIDLTLNRTRQALLTSYSSRQHYWALPILSMQPSFNGYLSSADSAVADEFDQMLFQPVRPSLKDLAQPKVTTNPPTQPPVAPQDGPVQNGADISATETAAAPTNGDIAESDLESLVETLEYEELLSYSEDSAVMADLVKQLSQPPTPDTIIPADTEESLLPEPLETPGLSIYDDLPTEAPTRAHSSDDTESTEATTPASVPEPETPPNPPAAESTAVDSPQPQPTRSRWQRPAVLGGIAIAAVAALALPTLFSSNSEDGPRLGALGNNTVLQSEQSLNAGNYDEAAEYLGALILNDQYADALALITDNPLSFQSNAEIAFLRGRAQWELYKRQSQGDYSPGDAISSWELALDLEPHWPDALVALGFAYYAKGEPEKAEEIWQQAIEVSKGRFFTAQTLAASVEPKEAGSGIINAYAGLAIVRYQFAAITIDDDIDEALWQEAVEAKNTALADSGTAFLSSNLGRSWLWVETTIGDWDQTKDKLAQYEAASE
ncbi:MAG: CHAT domain-containing protein [Cyanobacteria bacterium J06632_22]